MSSDDLPLVPIVSPDALVFERDALVGTLLGCLAYGIHLTIFTATAYLMLRIKPRSQKRKLPLWLHGYLWLMFILGTFNFAGSVKYYVEAVIDHRNTPGGPFAWFVSNLNNAVNLFANGAYVVAVFLQDGMLVYRLLVVWNYNIYLAVVAILGQLAVTVLACFAMFQTAHPTSPILHNTTIVFVVPFMLLSISLNLAMTVAIVARIIYLRKRIVASLGKQHARMYTSLAAMFIESGALYSVWGLIYVVSKARNSQVQNIVLQILNQVVEISPELIILRVTLGPVWSRDVTTNSTGASIRERTGAVPHISAGIADKEAQRIHLARRNSSHSHPSTDRQTALSETKGASSDAIDEDGNSVTRSKVGEDKSFVL